MRRLAVAKYAKISSPIAAWRIIVERHILPVAESSSKRFDTYLAGLMGPGVIATVLAWEPHIKALFTEYVKQAAEEKAAAAAAAAPQPGSPWALRSAPSTGPGGVGGIPSGHRHQQTSGGGPAARMGSATSSSHLRSSIRGGGRLASLTLIPTATTPSTPVPSEPPAPDKVRAFGL